MVKRIAIAFLFLAVVLESHGAATLLKRELFLSDPTNVGTLTSSSKDQFDSFTGTLPFVGVGAKAIGQADFGWSGLSSNVTGYGQWSCSGTGYITGWYYFVDFAPGQPVDFNHSSSFYAFGPSYMNDQLSIDSAGYFRIYRYSSGAQIAGPLPKCKWINITFAWKHNADNTMDYRLYTADLGGSLTQVFSTDNSTYGVAMAVMCVGVNAGSWNGPCWKGRMSGVSLYRITNFTDVALPSDLIEPPSDRMVWYVNPNTGSDLYDGLGPFTAFRSAARLATYLGNGAFIAKSDAPWAYVSDGSTVSPSLPALEWASGITNGTIRSNGDKIIVDTTAGAMDLDRKLYFSSPTADGIEFCSSSESYAELSMFKLVSSPYSQYDSVNYPNIWTTTDTEAKSVLWEDRRWMDGPVGANIAAVRTFLNSTPGSFWNDGTTIYFHPFESSDPNSLTNRFERSRKRLDSGSLAYTDAIGVTGTNSAHIHHISTGGNTFRDPTSGAVDAVYALHPLGGVRFAAGDCRLFYNGNHAYGATDGSANLLRLVYRSIGEQGPPYTTNSAGYTHFVEYYPNSDGGPRQAFFIDCNFATNAVIGSSLGTDGIVSGIGGLFSHVGGINLYPYSYIHIERCYGSVNPGIATNVVVTNSIIGDLHTYSETDVDRSRVVGQIWGLGPTTVKNSLLIPNANALISREGWISGGWTFENCTIDLSAIAGSAVQYLKIVTPECYLTNRNNVILAGNEFIRTGLGTITSDNNVVVMLNPYFYSDGVNKTWAQWLATGQDANSVTNVSACLNSLFRPYAKTPCWTTGAELGPATDFTGKVFQSRRTCGAYEYDPPSPRFLIAQ